MERPGYLHNNSPPMNIHMPPVYQKYLLDAPMSILISPQMYGICYEYITSQWRTHPGVMTMVIKWSHPIIVCIISSQTKKSYPIIHPQSFVHHIEDSSGDSYFLWNQYTHCFSSDSNQLHTWYKYFSCTSFPLSKYVLWILDMNMRNTLKHHIVMG